MGKYITVLMVCAVVVSCNAQKRDLEMLPYNKDLGAVVPDIREMQRDRELETTMSAYQTDNLTGYCINDIRLNNYTYDNTSYVQSNELYLLVDSYKANKFIGYVLRILDEKEANKLITYFQNKLGPPFKTKTYTKEEENYEDALYLWNKEKDRMTFIKKHSESRTNHQSGKEEKVTTTKIVVVKKGLSITPDAGNDPEKIKEILKENPHNFELIEVFKNQFL